LLGDTEILVTLYGSFPAVQKHQLFIHLLAIIVWVYNFLTSIVLSSLGGLNIGALNGGGRQVESRDQVKALCTPSLHSDHSKLSDITAG